MKRRKEGGAQKKTGGRKVFVTTAVIILLGICAVFAWMQFLDGEESVNFEEVSESGMPKDIASEVIPEYKTLERALACRVDDSIYVIVTRGEKPTSGFGVAIDRMALEEKDGRTNLIVYAVFDDPQKETAISQIITYPLQVVKTNLKELPDTIELRIQY